MSGSVAARVGLGPRGQPGVPRSLGLLLTPYRNNPANLARMSVTVCICMGSLFLSGVQHPRGLRVGFRLHCECGARSTREWSLPSSCWGGPGPTQGEFSCGLQANLTPTLLLGREKLLAEAEPGKSRRRVGVQQAVGLNPGCEQGYKEPRL